MDVILVISSILLWLVVLFILLLLIGLIRKVNQVLNSDPADMLPVGQEAPDFKAFTLTKETVTRADHLGQTIAYIFIGVQCEPCRTVLPTIETLQDRAKHAGVRLIIVSGDEVEETQTLVSELHLTLPVIVASKKKNTFFHDYHANVTPSYCLIDEKGVIQSAGVLSMAHGSWKRLTDSWLSADSAVVG